MLGEGGFWFRDMGSIKLISRSFSFLFSFYSVLGVLERRRILFYGRYVYRVADGVVVVWKYGRGREGSKS